MVKVSKPMIKTVTPKEHTLEKVLGCERLACTLLSRGSLASRSTIGTYTDITLCDGTWKPHIVPSDRKVGCEIYYSDVSLGGWKKQMLCCNGADTNIFGLRKQADVQLVFNREIVYGIDVMEKSK